MVRDYEQIKDHPNIGGWLLQTARHRVITSIRKEKRRNIHHSFSFDEQAFDSIEVDPNPMTRWLETLDSSELIGRIWESLTEKEKVVFVQYFCEGQTAKQTADDME